MEKMGGRKEGTSPTLGHKGRLRSEQVGRNPVVRWAGTEKEEGPGRADPVGP